MYIEVGKTLITTTKQQVIQHGLDFLHGLGTEHICTVCIESGGSCCNSCHLWDTFWDQIPGQEYRRDSTPNTVKIQMWLDIPDARSIGLAFIEDLLELQKDKKFNLIELNNQLSFHLNRITFYNDPEIVRYFVKKSRKLMRNFKCFYQETKKYHQLKNS